MYYKDIKRVVANNVEIKRIMSGGGGIVGKENNTWTY